MVIIHKDKHLLEFPEGYHMCVEIRKATPRQKDSKTS